MEPTIDPFVIGAASWRELASMVMSLWGAVFFVVLFASNMILGHILIPSFVMSGHISDRFSKARAPLYALAVICFAAAMFFIYRAIAFSGVLRDFWPDYWI